jgi:hypothetical protein
MLYERLCRILTTRDPPTHASARPHRIARDHIRYHRNISDRIRSGLVRLKLWQGLQLKGFHTTVQMV